MPLAITVDRKKIRQFCRKHHIRRLAFFGSVLREDYGPESDVDVLVEFEPDQHSRFAIFFNPGRTLSNPWMQGRFEHP